MKNLWSCIHVSFLRHHRVTDFKLPHIFVPFSFPLFHCPAQVSYTNPATFYLFKTIGFHGCIYCNAIKHVSLAVLESLNSVSSAANASLSCWCSPNIAPLLGEWPKQMPPVTFWPLHPSHGTCQRMFKNTQVSLRTFTQALWPSPKMMSKLLQLTETRRFIKIKVFSLEKISKY